MKLNVLNRSLQIVFMSSVFVLSGCSFYLTDILHDSPKKANNGFQYLKADADQKPFSIDQEHSNFNFNKKYVIMNENSNPEDAVFGKNIDITAPIQIVDIIPGAIANVVDNTVIINIDNYDKKNVDYENILWDHLLHFLTVKKIGIESVDSAKYTIQTDWLVSDSNLKRVTGEMYSDSNFDEYRTKYQISIRKDALGNIIQIRVNLTNIKVYNDGRRIYLEPDSFVRNRYASLFANEFISSLHTENGVTDNELRIAHTDYVTVKLGRDNNGQYAWVINADYDTSWTRFVKMLPNCGFDIRLSEKLRGIVDVNYDEPSDSWFEKNEIDNYVIEDGKYRFQVGLNGKNTVITIFTNSKQPLSDDLFLKMYTGFARTIEMEFNK